MKNLKSQKVLNKPISSEIDILFEEGGYSKLLTLILICFGLIIPILSFDFGVTWDERLSIKYSVDVLNYFLSIGDDKKCLDITIPGYGHLVYYGNIFGLTSALIQKIFPLDIVTIRHLLCSFLGFLTILYTSRIAKVIYGNKFSIAVILILISMPRFFGHIMNDFRDTTFMMGFVASVYYFIKIYTKLPSVNFMDCTKAAVMIFITCGVRIGGVILYVILFIVLMLWVIKNKEIADSKILKKIVFHFIFIFLLSTTLVLLIWPWAHQDVIRRPFEALSAFSDLQLILSYQLFNGELISNRNTPWNYLFVWIGITVPLVVLTGITLNFMGIRKSLFSRDFFIIIIITLTLPVVFYLMLKIKLYDSWRHFLFLTPFIALLSGMGWIKSGLILKNKIPYVIPIMFFVLLILPVKFMFSNHPFQTLYFNEIAGGIKGAFGKFELDIDGNSPGEAAKWFNNYLKNNNAKKIRIATNHDPLSISHFIDKDFIDREIIWLPYDKLYLKDWDYAIISSRTLSKYQLMGNWPYKEAIHHVYVDDIPVVSVLKREDRNLYLGLNRLEAGYFPDALKLFQSAVSWNPDLEVNHRFEGITQLFLHNTEEAEISFNKAFKLNPESSELLYFMGELQFSKEKYALAEKHLMKSKEFRSDNYRAEFLLAKIYLRRDETERAENIFLQLIKRKDIVNKDLSNIYNEYGELYFYKFLSLGCKTCINKTIDLFELSVNHNQSNYNPYINLIILYRKIGRMDFSEQTYKILESKLRLSIDEINNLINVQLTKLNGLESALVKH